MPESVEIEVVRPFDGAALLGFLGRRCIAGVEAYAVVDGVPHFTRTLRLPRGPGVLDVAWTGSALLGRTWTEAGDRTAAMGAISRLCDAYGRRPGDRPASGLETPPSGRSSRPTVGCGYPAPSIPTSWCSEP